MQPVLGVDDVRLLEEALAEAGVSLAELMHRAGVAAAREALSLGAVARIAVFCGFGNNGGDGWVAAEELLRQGARPCVVSLLEPEDIDSDLARAAALAAVEAGVEVLVAPPRDEIDALLADCDVVLDCILGTGFHGAPRAPFDTWIECINASGARVLAVDVPSGLSAQTGHAPGACVAADETLTMLSLKPGLLSDAGRDQCGEMAVAPLAEQAEQLAIEADPLAWRLDDADYQQVILPPTAAQDKYTRGSVLVVGGSARYTGAPLMAARAAARAGAGYVTLAVPEPLVGVMQAHLLEIPVVGLPVEPDGTLSASAADVVARLAAHRSATLVGPGMLVSPGAEALTQALLATPTSLVLDADALNCLARLADGRLDEHPELVRRTHPLVLTPHRGELGRLVGLADTPPDSLDAMLDAARRIVWASGGSELCVVAKGNASACVGVEAALLPTPGPAALATAGSGDVLGGIVAALLARAGTEPLDLTLLAALACEVHAAAGELAAERFGSRGVMAGDLIELIGLAADAVEQRSLLSLGDFA